MSTTTDANLKTEQDKWLERAQSVLMHTYASHPIVMDSGAGSTVTDANGKVYLDFIAGIAVTSLGHCDESYVKALTDQLSKISHCSNLFINKPCVELAEKLISLSPFDKAFFCNSGTEAIEGSIKLARKYAFINRSADCRKIVSMTNSFHGRTYGSLSATGQSKYQAGFQPMLPEFDTIPFNDLDSLSSYDFSTTAGIIIEPIQGEGGVHEIAPEYLLKLREICDNYDIVLIFDEIQCGIGRTGKLFAFEHLGVVPDVIALAKGLGGGFPIGAILASEKFAAAFVPGDHGTTFGGNPLACTAALACMTEISKPEFLTSVAEKGARLKNGLTDLQMKVNYEGLSPSIVDVRGKGLMLGVELSESAKPIIQKCIKKGFLLAGAGEKVLRLLPALTVSEEQIDQALSILAAALTEEN